MKKFIFQWQRKSCFLFLLLAVGQTGYGSPHFTSKTTVIRPVAWTITGKVVSPNGEPIPGVSTLR